MSDFSDVERAYLEDRKSYFGIKSHDVPKDDCTIEEYIRYELQCMLAHAMTMELAMHLHQNLWGVPVGPTLTMVYPTELKGISALWK